MIPKLHTIWEITWELFSLSLKFWFHFLGRSWCWWKRLRLCVVNKEWWTIQQYVWLWKIYLIFISFLVDKSAQHIGHFWSQGNKHPWPNLWMLQFLQSNILNLWEKVRNSREYWWNRLCQCGYIRGAVQLPYVRRSELCAFQWCFPFIYDISWYNM